ncbi:LysM peptidoglycan-binding domain-containing protein [Acidothermaceae bacterium B102]|nr:LysM peptidoglycan-binding domain-containing protein [Acidothermaceae bacterium B102]
MEIKRMQRAARTAVVAVAAVSTASAALLRLAWLPGVRVSGLPAALTSASPEQSLPLLLALAMCAFAGWLAVAVACTVAGQLPGTAGRWSRATLRRVAPAAVRRTLEVTLGLTTVLATTSGVAHAAGPAGRVATSQNAAVQQVAAPVLNLDRPASPTSAPAVTIDLDRPVPMVHHDPGRGLSLVTSVPTRMPAAQALSSPLVTVRPGDSLWRIAARALPRGASETSIERSWHRWYRANRSVIGPDPGLLQPGQQLVPPTS